MAIVHFLGGIEAEPSKLDLYGKRAPAALPPEASHETKAK
jgi:hypothetical protein